MALPTILINNSTGSDTLSSGAGPSTAVNGSAAATDGTNGKTVTITDAVNLSGVATDGSAVVFINDSTAGHRNFDNITAVSGTSGNWTVTVQNGFSLSLSGKSWAIGGKRASIGSGTSNRLVNNNSASGDAMPGWTMQLDDGHSETLSATLGCYRNGDTTNGPITIRGASGFVTRPLLTFSNNGDAINPRATNWVFRDFELQNSNATKTASNGFDLTTSAGFITIKNVKVANSTNKFWRGISWFLNGGPIAIEDCEIGNTADAGIIATGGGINGLRIKNNWIHSCGAQGIYFNLSTTQITGCEITGNLIVFSTNEGVKLSDTTSSSYAFLNLSHNVIHGNGGDGINIAWTNARSVAFANLKIENNRLTFNGGYGLDFSGTGLSDTVLSGFGVAIRNNNFVSNTSGKYNGMTVASSMNETTTDPSGGLASATKDYAGATGGSNFMSIVDKGKGYPIGGTLAIGTGSSSYTYVDFGLQHQDAGGSTIIFIDD